jgi:ribosomal protein S27AE
LRLFGIPDQVVRIAVLFVVAIVLLLFARQRFVPESFGEIGHYRADVLDTLKAQEVAYAGLAVCAECHTDEAESKSASYHRGLTCEGCHGPAAKHALEDPSEYRPEVPGSREACLRCHAYLSSRPTGFPQILADQHNPMEPCGTCHDPHDPTPPEVPGECSACHAAISSTKALSHHREVGCETCHEASPLHREYPRAYLPRKPAAREFCGHCHAATDRGGVEAPQVDLASHGGRYLCWQCHYPHFPEGR